MPVIERKTKSNKNVRQMVAFAHFCIDYSIDPSDAAELINLLKRSINADTNYLNVGTDQTRTKAAKISEKFVECATALGIKNIEWDSLVPTAKALNHRTGREETINVWPVDSI